MAETSSEYLETASDERELNQDLLRVSEGWVGPPLQPRLHPASCADPRAFHHKEPSMVKAIVPLAGPSRARYRLSALTTHTRRFTLMPVAIPSGSAITSVPPVSVSSSRNS